MTAFNAVRFKVKSGRDKEFLDAHKGVSSAWPGLRHANIIKTILTASSPNGTMQMPSPRRGLT